MSMDFQKLLNSPFAIRFASLIVRGIPPGIGYPLCNLIGDWIATRRDSRLAEVVRVNQWMARGASLQGTALDRAVRETLQNNVRDIYNLYHYLKRPQAVQQMIHISPEACEVIQRPEFAERGLVVLGLHLSNFDLILRSICQHGFKALVLTIPDPQGGRRVEYEMRKQTGMNVVPTSVGALRGAIRHLEQGGMVLTGIDRPIRQPKQQPMFFGKPASLPTHHIYLASRARVLVVLMAAIQQVDGRYHVFRSEFIEMEAGPDHEMETLRNAERVLKQAEHFIRLAPEQWNVPLPVWPELLVNIS